MKTFFLLSFFILSLLPNFCHAASTRAATSSTCMLVNPPNSSVNWDFMGNQGIWVKMTNCNVLWVLARLTWPIAGTERVWQEVLSPFSSSPEKYYSIFGYTPIHWKFELSTISDAASISAHARWNKF